DRVGVRGGRLRLGRNLRRQVGRSTDEERDRAAEIEAREIVAAALLVLDSVPAPHERSLDAPALGAEERRDLVGAAHVRSRAPGGEEDEVRVSAVRGLQRDLELLEVAVLAG